MRQRVIRGDDGMAMAALLVALAVMAIALSVALPSWRTASQREREAELIFRGQQYARAISLYQRKYANAFPATVDLLVDQRFLRKKYKDPMASDGEFQVLYAGQATGPAGQGPATTPIAGQQGRGGAAPMPQTALAGLAAATGGIPAGARGGIMGVASKNTDTSLRLYNGRSKYNEWTFVATLATTQAGAPTGSQNPTGGIGGRDGRGGRGPGIGGGIGGGVGGGRDGRGGRGGQDPFAPGNRQNGPAPGGGQPRGGGGFGGFGTGFPTTPGRP